MLWQLAGQSLFKVTAGSVEGGKSYRIGRQGFIFSDILYQLILEGLGLGFNHL